MRPLRLAIATSESAPELNPDDAPTAEHLRSRGVVVNAAPWSDPAVDWSRFDAVLIRSTWDYHTRYDEFMRWLDRLEQLRVGTINATPLLRWNSDKRYLAQLSEAGVGIVPTQLARADGLSDVLGPLHGREIVVKPTVSANAWCTVRGRVGEAAFAAAIAELPADLTYLVQPFIAEVASEGEWSLMFFGGAYSHAILKRPAQGDFRVQRELGGTFAFLEPEPAMIESARRAIRAVEALGFDRAAYARIDGVRSGGRFLIMEVEMIEPSLFLEGASGAAERFSEAVLAAAPTRVRS